MNKVISKIQDISSSHQLDGLNVIAVTGKMASGKNYVSSQFEKLGWASVDADLLVHVAIDQAAEKITQTFSGFAAEVGILLTKPQGKIDRRALGQLLFARPDLMKKQEEIVYPIITKMVEDFIAENKKVIINATVLYKTPEILAKCQKIIYVKAPTLKRFFRAKKRDGLPVKQIIRRFMSQKNLYREYKITKIPIIIIKN